MAIFCNFAPNLRFYMKLYSDAELAEILDKDIFHKIGEAADGMGVECYLVGGYVRDIFLERPTNDIDVVVVGSGIEVAKKLQQLLGTNPKTGRPRAHLAVYRNFGTAQVKFYDTEVEFVGARKESYNRLSRKPIVEDGTLSCTGELWAQNAGVVISGGTVSLGSLSVERGSVTITGGTVTLAQGLWLGEGDITVSGGEVIVPGGLDALCADGGRVVVTGGVVREP